MEFEIRQAASILGWLGDKIGVSPEDRSHACLQMREHGLFNLAQSCEAMTLDEFTDFLTNEVWG